MQVEEEEMGCTYQYVKFLQKQSNQMQSRSLIWIIVNPCVHMQVQMNVILISATFLMICCMLFMMMETQNLSLTCFKTKQI
eukprot:Em0025g11a